MRLAVHVAPVMLALLFVGAGSEASRDRIEPGGSRALPVASKPPSDRPPKAPAISTKVLKTIKFPDKVILPQRGNGSWRRDARAILSFDRSLVHPNLNAKKQNLHVRGALRHVLGRSTIFVDKNINPDRLLAEFRMGKHKIVGLGGTGLRSPIVDFGKPIGLWHGRLPTRFGRVHSGKDGSHIVPASPFQY